MNPEFLSYFEIEGETPVLKNGGLCARGQSYEVRNGIPRFTPDDSYSRGNFSLLREKHARLQLDSFNHTGHRRETILSRTGWPAQFFRDKTVLECGSGAGPDTEILADLGARIMAVDLAGVDAAKENLKNHASVQFVQDDITRLHLKPESFDIVFCHRTLQHTPDPAKTLLSILRFVKPGGAVFVHSYADHPRQTLRWKYFLRPVTTRMNPERLYKRVTSLAPLLFKFTLFTRRHRFGRAFNHYAVPFLNYRDNPYFKDKDNAFILEYGIHDTFDALSARYDRPMKAETMRAVARKSLIGDHEVVDRQTFLLLRTKVQA